MVSDLLDLVHDPIVQVLLGAVALVLLFFLIMREKAS
jgi:hypothetical protein